MQNTDIGIYIHWPFCVSKCPYCDFNSHIQRSIEEEQWCTAILKELRFYHQHTHQKNVKSIFFGGGTPSLMHPKTVEKVIHFIKENWTHDAHLEITLEANPNSVEVSKFENLKKAGVNRVSIGIQSFNKDDLKFLGRGHSADEAVKAIETAEKYFNNFSFDLIYALPKQRLEEWEKELHYALSFNTKHISLYQLTIEQNTPFYKQYHMGGWQMPSHNKAAEFYEMTQDITKQKGLPSYEISNHAKSGFECQHNLIYWRYQNFIGVGPGAHGRVFMNNTVAATQNFKSPKKWLQHVLESSENGCETSLQLISQEIFEERLLMGLRLKEELILRDEELKYVSKEQLNLLEKEGFLSFNKQKSRLSIKEKGFIVLNSIINNLSKT